MSYLLIHGDSRQLPIDLESVDAVVSDPPYGMDWDPDSTRFSGGQSENNRYRGQGRAWEPIHGDCTSFDPSPWLEAPRVVLWGCNHFAARLPVGTTLVWIKKHDHLFGTFLSDAELGWMKGGYGVYCFRWSFPPPSRGQENGGTYSAHPNQKPVALMRWCIRKLNLKPNSLILDPYMGSGTTGVAALAEGHRFVGIEIDRRYVDVARRRILRPHARPMRPSREESHPLFDRSTPSTHQP